MGEWFKKNCGVLTPWNTTQKLKKKSIDRYSNLNQSPRYYV